MIDLLCPNCLSVNVGLNEIHNFSWKSGYYMVCYECNTVGVETDTQEEAMKDWKNSNGIPCLDEPENGWVFPDE